MGKVTPTELRTFTRTTCIENIYPCNHNSFYPDSKHQENRVNKKEKFNVAPYFSLKMEGLWIILFIAICYLQSNSSLLLIRLDDGFSGSPEENDFGTILHQYY